MNGCFGNMCTCVYCVLYCFVYIYLFFLCFGLILLFMYFYCYVYVFLLLCLFCSVYFVFVVPTGILRLPWLMFFRVFSSVVRQMPGYNSQRWGTARPLPKLIVLFCVLFVCKCVLYYCRRVSTQLQLTNICIWFTGAEAPYRLCGLQYRMDDQGIVVRFPVDRGGKIDFSRPQSIQTGSGTYPAFYLILILLTWRIGWAHNNGRK